MILNNFSKGNKGSGIAVIIYGVVLMLLFIFTAINILNAKVIENAYNSLRDGVLAASSGSVIHLLTPDAIKEEESTQNSIIAKNNYDIYLQLALGYIINRTNSNSSSTAVQGAEINNFIKLDHKKVVNSTMAILDDAVMRDRVTNTDISDTDKFKIFMFFIEPHYTEDDFEKYFDIIMYTNKDYDPVNGIDIDSGTPLLAGGEVNTIEQGSKGSMEAIYKAIESCINNAVNNPGNFVDDGDELLINKDFGSDSFKININASGNLDELVRDMETMPYYLIVVKDFALPTLFNGVDTNTEDNNIFTFLSGNGSLNTPMCALNSGKTERKLKE